MRDRPADLAEAELMIALAEGWGMEPRSAEYLPVGAGSHHWSVVDRRGPAWFVKVDDLGAGDAGRDDAFDGLERAFGVALALRRDAGLDFVLAPAPAATGALVRRLTSRYALSVFPMVEGAAGHFGAHRPEDRAEVAGLLAALHEATPLVADIAPRSDLALPGRDGLVEALRDLDREWTGGPYAEPARALLTAHAGQVRRSLAEFDSRVEQVRDPGTAWVVTHGEPHPGNVLRTPDGPRLIDWDTVLVAPPERDLWMLTPALARMLGEDETGDGGEVLARYTRLTGRAVTEAGLALYPLWWRLADIAAFVDDLRRPHGPGGDAAAALTYLTGHLESGRD
ncbi:phosphotransferase [Microbispora triticiradicis]|uniref:phosphotransferase n=1 Tax=Microbispora triticiradicis TaxID=2200763 RepID=UPI001AD6B181|nr:phosphotransferase [Microbispora triticiradicis]